ncbi:MAG: hypothetical protein IT196_23200 [Acidimicrobiales bacterium]|nr:hypothetical protein [Acidimicrobiales bacterium]
MLSPREEQELRNRTADLVLGWHLEQRGALESADAAGYRSLVEAAAVVADESETSLRNWVSAARRAGLSWEEIGTCLGVTRQAAQKRFAPPEPAVAAAGLGERIVRNGVLAFNEVEVLQVEGLLGRRVVGAGWAKLYFEQTDQPWENVRVVSLRRGKPIAEMEAEGWSHVFSWYPYTYYTRPLGHAATSDA